MAAASYNMEIEQGASYSLSIRYADSGNIPVDLNNFNCARMQWVTDSNETHTFITSNSNSGLYLFEFASPLSSGIINFKIPASITAGYNFISANYDMELESNSDLYSGGGPEIIRLVQGTVTISPEITKITCSGVP